MFRLLLALVLLLCLQPAAAQEGESPSAQNGIAALTSPPATAAPAGWRLDLFRRQPPSGAKDSPSPRPPALAGARAISTDLAALRRSAAATVARHGVRLPRLEHLPYYATAPPSRT